MPMISSPLLYLINDDEPRQFARGLVNELAAIRATRVKAFCLTAGGLKGEVQAANLLRHINRIIQRARKTGLMVRAVIAIGYASRALISAKDDTSNVQAPTSLTNP